MPSLNTYGTFVLVENAVGLKAINCMLPLQVGGLLCCSLDVFFCLEFALQFAVHMHQIITLESIIACLDKHVQN